MSAEPLQTLCTILHQPAQPREAARREPLISKSHPALPAHILLSQLPNDVTLGEHKSQRHSYRLCLPVYHLVHEETELQEETPARLSLGIIFCLSVMEREGLLEIPVAL